MNQDECRSESERALDVTRPIIIKSEKGWSVTDNRKPEDNSAKVVTDNRKYEGDSTKGETDNRKYEDDSGTDSVDIALSDADNKKEPIEDSSRVPFLYR